MKTALVIAMFLTACNPLPEPIPNEDIVREAKRCTDAGLKWERLVNGVGETVRVECKP